MVGSLDFSAVDVKTVTVHVPFGNPFTTTPRFSVITTGYHYSTPPVNSNFGWNVRIVGVSINEGVFNFTAVSYFHFITLKYVVVQRDCLQVFIMSAAGTSSATKFTTVPLPEGALL